MRLHDDTKRDRTGATGATNRSTTPPPSNDSRESDDRVLALSEDLRSGLDNGDLTWPGLVRLLSRPEAARVLSIGVWTLDELIAKGELTPTRIGRSVRVSTTEINAFIDRKTNPPAPDTFAWPVTGQQRKRVGSRR